MWRRRSHRYAGPCPTGRSPLADVVVTEDDIARVADVYRSGWLSMGPRTAEFEARFAAYTGARHALAVANGTAALHLMCLAAGLGPGDEVIVPSLTFVATVNAIALHRRDAGLRRHRRLERAVAGAAAVEAAITPRTRAIMTMGYGGHPGEIAALRELARDARPPAARGRRARASASRLDGRHLGTLRRRRRLQLLLEQEPGGRRGRRGRHRRRGARRARCGCCARTA